MLQATHWSPLLHLHRFLLFNSWEPQSCFYAVMIHPWWAPADEHRCRVAKVTDVPLPADKTELHQELKNVPYVRTCSWSCNVRFPMRRSLSSRVSLWRFDDFFCNLLNYKSLHVQVDDSLLRTSKDMSALWTVAQTIFRSSMSFAPSAE
jgi:hypothetical protein